MNTLVSRPVRKIIERTVMLRLASGKTVLVSRRW
jgi:hypothetical protein